jgi:CspA family cold shock protein
MPLGRVKWFNNAKGYGFVLPEGGGEDLFVHYSSIQMEGYKTLKAGQPVEYDLQAGPKGMHAVNIRALEDAPGEPLPRAAVEAAAQAAVEEARRDAPPDETDEEREARLRRVAERVRQRFEEKFHEPSH